jgi:hypothetical protein
MVSDPSFGRRSSPHHQLLPIYLADLSIERPQVIEQPKAD